MDEAVKHLLPAVEEQMASPDTPYVRATFARLLRDPDIEEEEAKAMIAFCLADELEAVAREGRSFDAERYEMLLTLLPAMPEGR